jgi:LPXTG-motif cell wall-anchored protein
MFVSRSTQKIYFSTELNVYEMGYNGSSLVSLYSGPNTTLGIQNIAVDYGATQSTLAQVVTAAKAAQNSVAPPQSTLTSPAVPLRPTLASTGAQEYQNSWIAIAGLSAMSLGLFLLFLRKRIKPKSYQNHDELVDNPQLK